MTDYSGARDDPTCDKNSNLLELEACLIRFCVCFIKFEVNFWCAKIRVPYSVAYGEQNIS